MPKRGPTRISSKDVRKRWQKNGTQGAQTATEPADQTSQRPARAARRRRTSWRAGFAVVSGRAVGALSRRLHLGGGTSVVGVVAQRLYPDIVGHLASQLELGSVLVTGTNGKTTTSGFIAAILSDAGLRVWRNREGSNLMRGIASSLVIRALPNGRLRRSGRAISIFEVDEAVVPQAVRSIAPRVAVFTNLFRDQLDRYGEVDSVATRWQSAIRMLSPDSVLVLNADDPATAYLGKEFEGSVYYYGIDALSLDISHQLSSANRHQVIDTRTCPKCGGEYIYDMRFYSHMGHYTCEGCGLTRPQPNVRVVQVEDSGFDRLRISVATETGQHDMVIPLPGLYNIYNALAAITVAQALHIGWEPIVTGIEQFKPVFGRGERVQVEGRTVRLLLAKNPTGFNEVLRTLFSSNTRRYVLFVLNDNIADGRDISWIWDVDFERIIGQTDTLVVGGTRSLDLALRLKYAGVAEEAMTIVPPNSLRSLRRALEAQERGTASKRGAATSRSAFFPSRKGQGNQEATAGGRTALTTTEGERPARHAGLAEAFDSAIRQTPEGETLFVVPTYTGLLEIHRLLEQRGLTPHYWEGKDS